jgi:hypothetical protein
MAFISDYEHDVFVSYAHLDNQGETAWVSTLVRHLDTDLRQRLGTKDLRIWIDETLDGNRPLTPEIMRAIQRSATLLVVMSSGYLASEWCAKERNAFLGFVHDCVAAGRIFIVHCRETDRTAIPPEFGDLIGFKFWTQDPEAGGATRPLGLGTLCANCPLVQGTFGKCDPLQPDSSAVRPDRGGPQWAAGGRRRRGHCGPPRRRRAHPAGLGDRPDASAASSPGRGHPPTA